MQGYVHLLILEIYPSTTDGWCMEGVALISLYSGTSQICEL